MHQLDHLEPATKKFIEEINAHSQTPLYKLSIPEARKVLEDVQSGHLEKPAVRIEDFEIPGGSHPAISIRIFRPPQKKGKLPVIMYFHGGGWILGSQHTHDRLVRELCIGTNAAVVFVDYSRSPEEQYPIAVEQGYIATKYIFENGARFMLDPRRIAVAGDSVGGNMAAVTALLCKDRTGPRLCRQVLFYPVTDAAMNTASYQQFSEGPWLTKLAMEWFWNAYAPDRSKREKPSLSPLRASLDQLKQLPPALVITAENDVLRDEGEAYAHRLMQAGVEVTAVRCIGTIHDFMMLNALRETPAVRQALDLACATLRAAFKTKKARLSRAA